MAHYALLDAENTVVEVIVGLDEDRLIDGKTPEIFYSEIKGLRCVRTSYNGNIRKNFAGVGFYYDEARDAFVPPKPYTSWTLDEETCLWNAPVDIPTEGGPYAWNEEAQSWETAES